MRPRPASRLALVVALFACAGCDPWADDGPIRDWQASDHAQPSAPDPSRQAGSPEGTAEPTEAEVRQAVAELYLERCASCHGAEGRGDGPEAPTAAMPDLTLPAYHDGVSDADIARVIRMGQGLMPAFGGQLNERGIAALTAHVRRLRRGDGS